MGQLFGKFDFPKKFIKKALFIHYFILLYCSDYYKSLRNQYNFIKYQSIELIIRETKPRNMQQEDNDFHIRNQTFLSAGLHTYLNKIYNAAGYVRPTPVQYYSIKESKKDEKSMVCRSKSGTGKTLAFLSIILESLVTEFKYEKMTYCVIVLPTRQLAVQVYQTYKKIEQVIFNSQPEGEQQKRMKMLLKDCNAQLTIGGINFDDDRKKYREDTPKILVSTIGRLYELLNQNILNFSENKFHLVLDEGDKLFGSSDQKFSKILNKIPKNARWLIFSATYNKEVLNKLVALKSHKYIQTTLSKNNNLQILITQNFEQQLNFQKEQELIDANSKEGSTKFNSDLNLLSNIHRFMHKTPHSTDKSLLQAKISQLNQILESLIFHKCLIFVSKKSFLQEIAQSLEKFQPLLIHGGMSQAQRFRVMNRLNQKQVKIVITSDLLARGIDVYIDLVILFDIGDHDTFWHRIGRTGRYGRTGVVVALKQQKQAQSQGNLWQDYQQQLINQILKKARASFMQQNSILQPINKQEKQDIQNNEQKVKNFWYGEHMTELGRWVDVDPQKQLENNYKYYIEPTQQNRQAQQKKSINLKALRASHAEINDEEIIPQFQSQQQLAKFVNSRFLNCLECIEMMENVSNLTGYEFQILKYCHIRD